MQLFKYKYIISLSLILGLSSCSRNNLNLNPHDQLSQGTFWKTQQDGQLALTGCYHTLATGYFNMNNFAAWDALTDDSWTLENDIGAQSAMIAPITSTTGGIITGFYNTTYKAIGVCNYFLDNIGSVDVPASQLDEWKAEVLFLRSFYYFYLTQFYGDVPLTLHSYTLSDSLLPKSPKADVENQILGDLNTAIQSLPDQAYTDGHVVKGTALMLKAKIALYDNNFQDAASLTSQIMQSGTFSLYPDYYTLFLTKGQGADNKEIMFSVRYLSPNDENQSNIQWGWYLGVSPFQNLVDAYECTDGLPITQSPLYNPAQPYSNRDPRLNATIVVPGSSYGFGPDGAAKWDQRRVLIQSPLLYNIRKYVDSTIQGVSASQHCENDVVIFRYADVLLSYAEAQNENSGPDASVYQAVNDVRTRPSVNLPPLASGLSQAQMRDTIRHERRIELAFESQRWLDLKRWNLGVEKIGAIGTDQSPVKYVFLPNNYLWPFPQSEIDYYKAHGHDLGQNPGY
ncbi:MAG: RagB/SusD family nutrient uptake outer membrane protein [Bacteroidota bacterium]|nr:RagB/SusD family nutrient uptake outer membrane protein [Bacteroidota bacterium]